MAEKGKIPTPKTQRELLNSQINPYNPPGGSVGYSGTGNPNPNPEFNRGEQTSFRNDTVKPFTLGFKEIDEAIIYYMDNVIKPTVQQNGVVQKVPFIYGSPERWKQVQKDGYYRDLKGKIMMPIITFKRNNIEKVRSLANKLDANNPNNLQIFTKSYSQQNAYDNFNILNNQVPTKQNYAVVMPDYVNITYDFIISTYYIEQLNKIIEAVNYASDSYWGNPERFQFKSTINNFATPVELVTGGERIVKSTFSLKLYGYIVPDTIQKEMTSIKKFNSKAQIKFNLETTSQIGGNISNNFTPNNQPEIESDNNPSTFTET
tara:strand:- start:1596 stop:2549 length:954 start_codon:yes stop_codon:yes gene_type:complete